MTDADAIRSDAMSLFCFFCFTIVSCSRCVSLHYLP